MSIPVALCRYIDDAYIAIAYATNDQLTQATEVVRYIAAASTGYPPPLVLNLQPEDPQPEVPGDAHPVYGNSNSDRVLQQGGRGLDKEGKHSAGSASFNTQHGVRCDTES